MSLLNWEDAHRGHISDLKGFQATYFTKPKGLRGSAWPPRHLRGWWEYEVQQDLRALEPPRQPGPRLVRVGCDLEGLGAVSVALELDGPAEVEWEYGAIALRLRRQGGGYADEMCRDLFDQLTARAVEAQVLEIRIVGYVWHENRPSQEMLRRNGFLHTDAAGDGVQFWERYLLV